MAARINQDTYFAGNKYPMENCTDPYRLIAEHLTDGIVIGQMIFDAQGKPADYMIMEVNSSYEKRLNINISQITGKSVREVLPFVHSEWIEKCGSVVKTGLPIEYEQYNDTLDRWFEVQVISLFHDNQFAFVLTDIDRRKRAEEKLRESEERFRTVQENSYDRFMILEPFYNDQFEIVDFTYAHLNLRAAKTVGRSPEELIGHHITEFFNTFPQTPFFTKYKQVMETGKTLEFENQYKINDEDQWVRATVTPVRNGIAIAQQIITERRQAEMALRESEERQAFLLKLSDKLRTLTDPGAIQKIAINMLGEHLGADHVLFFRVEGDAYVVEQNYTAVEPHIVGYYPLTSFGVVLLEGFHDGRTMISPDLTADTILTSDDKAAFASFRIASGVGVPSVRDNLFEAGLAVLMTSPRIWTTTEISLIEETAKRTWAAQERIKTEEALRYADRRFRTMANAAPILMWESDATGVVFVNQHCLDFLGADFDTISKMGWANFLHPEDSAAYVATYQNAFQQRATYTIEYRCRRADGQYRWLSTTGQPTGERCFVGISFDITDHRQAEESLRESEEKYRTLVKLAPAAFYEVDFRNNCFLAVNDVVCEMSGYTREEILKINPFDILDDEGKAVLEKRRTKWLNGEVPDSKIEYRVKTKSGDEKYLSMDVKFTHGENGKPLGATAVGHDITQRRKIEEALKDSEQKARALVSELELADKNKNQFIGVLSHELRNPLAVIVASLALLEVADRPEQVSKTKDIVKRQVGQLTKLVDDLLDVTRITQKKVKLKKESVNLVEILANVALDLELEYKEKGVKLHTDFLGAPVIVSADPVRISQCIINLLWNALKYTSADGNVTLSLETKDGEAVISVRDDGIGINTSLLEHLFEPFIQADSLLNRPTSSGLGLGLSIVKGIVLLHGGSVTAYSEGLGKGSLFTVRMPVLTQLEEIQNSADETKKGRNYRILLIEDNKDLSDVLCSLLGAMGHQADSAESGMEGITAARKIRPDIIFCDIGLPDFSGYDVARILKADSDLKRAKLIALTGYASEYDLKQTWLAGFERHLSKPVDMALLEKIINEIN